MVIGQLKALGVNISEPLKMEHLHMDVNQIMILVGTNGSGKTLILKLNWIMATQINFILAGKKLGTPISEIANLQFLFDKSFDDNNFEGDLSLEYMDGSTINVSLEKGKVTKLDTNLVEGLEPGGMPVFMSKETRLLSDVIKYIKFKKMLGFPSGMPTDENHLDKILNMYKIYDVIFMEQLLHRIEHNKTPDKLKKLRETLNGFDPEFNLIDISVDYLFSDILYSTDKIVDKSVATLGAGHQSIITQFAFLILE